MLHLSLIKTSPTPSFPFPLIVSVPSRKRRGEGEGGVQSFSNPPPLCRRGSYVVIHSWVRHPFYPLLQVLQDASEAEVVDVPAKIHQLGVDVCGHTAVGRGGEVRAAGHHAGAARWGAFSTPLHQGTKSTNTHTQRGKKKIIKDDTLNLSLLSAEKIYKYMCFCILFENNKRLNLKQVFANDVYANVHGLVFPRIH